jgi:hypothetical protein
MNSIGTNQLVGIILIGSAVVDSYILPKILLKKFNQAPSPTTTPQQKAVIERKRKTMKLVIAIATSIPAILGLLFFMGIIPLENN